MQYHEQLTIRFYTVHNENKDDLNYPKQLRIYEKTNEAYNDKANANRQNVDRSIELFGFGARDRAARREERTLSRRATALRKV